MYNSTCYTIVTSFIYTICVGDIVVVLEKRDDGWWKGLLNEIEGLFPSAYCEEIASTKRVLNIDTKKTSPSIYANM